MDRRRRSGLTLSVTLLIVPLALLAVFAVAGAATLHLRVIQSSANHLAARQAAESAVASAIQRLLAERTFGRNGDTLTVTVASRARASVVFGRQPDRPYATWNLDGNGSELGYLNVVVSPSCVHVVAEGGLAGNRAVAEAIVRLPRLPALAAAGPVIARGGVVIGSLADVGTARRGIDTSQLQPSGLVSNSDAPDAVVLGAGSDVVGDVQTPGDVVLEGGAQVRGRLDKRRARKTALPFITMPDFSDRDVTRLNVSQLSSPVLNGFVEVPGSLDVSGDLTLQGVLKVPGSLVVNGSLFGRGAVFVGGDVLVVGAGDLETDQVAALISMGNVEIRGRGRDGSRFVGLVYSGKDFKASDVVLLGAFVAAGADNQVTLPRMEVSQATVVSVPELSRLSLSFPAVAADTTQFIGGGHYVDNSLSPFIVATAQFDPAVLFDKETGQYRIDRLDVNSIRFTYRRYMPTELDWPQWNDMRSRGEMPPGGTPIPPERIGQVEAPITEVNGARDSAVSAIRAELDKANRQMAELRAQQKARPPGRFDLDLNQFISPEERFSVLLWQIR